MYNSLNESSTNESDSSIRNLFVVLSYFETASDVFGFDKLFHSLLFIIIIFFFILLTDIIASLNSETMKSTQTLIPSDVRHLSQNNTT